jgi:hypothetical protein
MMDPRVVVASPAPMLERPSTFPAGSTRTAHRVVDRLPWCPRDEAVSRVVTGVLCNILPPT